MTQNNLSIGRAASDLGILADQLRLILSDLSIRPIRTDDGVAYFSVEDIERARRHLAGVNATDLQRRASGLH